MKAKTYKLEGLLKSDLNLIDTIMCRDMWAGNLNEKELNKSEKIRLAIRKSLGVYHDKK